MEQGKLEHRCGCLGRRSRRQARRLARSRAISIRGKQSTTPGKRRHWWHRARSSNATAPSARPPAVLERADLGLFFAALQRRGFTIVGPTVRDGAICFDELRTRHFIVAR
jgi:hypothetical protein